MFESEEQEVAVTACVKRHVCVSNTVFHKCSVSFITHSFSINQADKIKKSLRKFAPNFTFSGPFHDKRSGLMRLTVRKTK